MKINIVSSLRTGDYFYFYFPLLYKHRAHCRYIFRMYVDNISRHSTNSPPQVCLLLLLHCSFDISRQLVHSLLLVLLPLREDLLPGLPDHRHPRVVPLPGPLEGEVPQLVHGGAAQSLDVIQVRGVHAGPPGKHLGLEYNNSSSNAHSNTISFWQNGTSTYFTQVYF